MKLTLNGRALGNHGFSLIESLDNYCSTLEFYTEDIVGDSNYGLEDGKGNKVSLVVETTALSGKGTNVILTPLKYRELKNSTFESYNGLADVEKLVSFLGIDFNPTFKTQESFWSIPQLKLLKLIDQLNSYTSVHNGGGVRFYIDLLGSLNICDLKSAYNQIPKINLLGTITSAKFQRDWMIDYPGKFNLVTYSTDGTTEESIILEEGYGSGTFRFNQSSEDTKDLPKQKLNNEFYRKFYTAHQFMITCSPTYVVSLGQNIILNNTQDKFKFIVYEIRRTVDNTGTQLPLNIMLVSCPKLSKQ